MIKRKGIIIIKNLDSKENSYAVDFDGYQEGSGSPCSNQEEVKKEVEYLLKKHNEKYDIEIKDERIKCIQMTL